MNRLARPFLAATYLATVTALAGCPDPNAGDQPSITVTATPLSVLADGIETVSVTVNATMPNGDPAEGLLVLTTDRGSFEGGGKSMTGALAGGNFGPVTLTSCDSFAEADCAGTARVRAALGPASSTTAVAFEEWRREVNCEDGVDDDEDGLFDCADVDDCADGMTLSNGNVCFGGGIACQPNGDAGLAEEFEATCGDAIDNDCNGTADCDDAACDTVACSANGEVCSAGTCACSFSGIEAATVADCYDGIDNDCDGLADGADPECLGRACSVSGQRWGDDGAGGIICDCFQDQDPEAACQDGFDNDCDGVADCADSDCDNAACDDASAAPNDIGLTCGFAAAACTCGTDALGTGIEAACNNGVDDDCDGLTDCEDEANCTGQSCGANGVLCSAASPSLCECPGGAIEMNCSDSIDDDCDGDFDCDDSDCAGNSCGANGLACDGATGTCVCPGGQISETSCGDTLDNDCDGLRDCADPNCDVLLCNSCGFTNCICNAATTACEQDPGLNRLTFTADATRVIAAYFSDGVEVVLTALVEDNGGVVAGYNVDFSVPQGTIVESNTSLHSMVTDANGLAVVHWRPENQAGKLVPASATIVTDPGPGTTTTKEVLVDIIGLDNVLVQNVQFSTMGARDSGWQESNDISFRVLGTNGTDTGLTIPDGVTVDFTLSNTGAGGLTLTQFSGVTLSGLVSTTAIAGTQAVPFTVTATVDVVGTTDTATTSTINIVGAKPNYQGFTFSCSKKNVNGLGDFPTDSNFSSTNVSVTVGCSVNVSDRWNNPVASAAGVSVLFTGEAGVIETNKPVTNGTSSTNFRTVGALPFDTTPVANEPNWIHTYNSVTQIRNPRDGFYTLIAYVTGEEAFTDGNGNAVYDAGEQWIDLGEPFVDRDDSGAWEAGEFFFDSNTSGTYNGPNGQWDAQTTIWDETRIVVSGCCGPDPDAPVPALGFQTPFGPIDDGGSASSLLRVADLNMNSLAGGTSLTVGPVAPSALSRAEFPDGTTARPVPDGWGMAWVESTDCSAAPQCVHATSISFSPSTGYGYEVWVTARDGTANNTSCDLAAPNCTQPGATCVDPGTGIGECQNYVSFSVRAQSGPCTPKSIFTEGGTVD